MQHLIVRIDDLPEPVAIKSIDDYPKLVAIKAKAVSISPDGYTFGHGLYLFLRASNDGTIETSENPFVTEPVTNQMRLKRLSPTPSSLKR